MKKENTSTRLKQLMETRNLKQVDILKACEPFCKQYNVKMNKSDLSQYVSGKVEPNQAKLFVLGNALGVNEAWLMGYDAPMDRINNKHPGEMGYGYMKQIQEENKKALLEASEIPEGFSPPPEMVLKPLVGKIVCGTPILAEQNIENYIHVPKDMKCDFLFTCDGDSMIEAGIRPGDVVYLIKQPDIDYNGQIAAVRVDGEATLKKVFKYQDKVVLQPANANYEPLVYIKEEMNDLVVEGIATGFTHKFIN